VTGHRAVSPRGAVACHPRLIDSGATVCSGPGVGTSAAGLEHCVERRGETGEVAVVDPAVVELAGELVEQVGPVPAGR
jgi:hypothetical protein